MRLIGRAGQRATAVITAFQYLLKMILQHISVGSDVPSAQKQNVAVGCIDDVWMMSVYPYKYVWNVIRPG